MLQSRGAAGNASYARLPAKPEAASVPIWMQFMERVRVDFFCPGSIYDQKAGCKFLFSSFSESCQLCLMCLKKVPCWKIWACQRENAMRS